MPCSQKGVLPVLVRVKRKHLNQSSANRRNERQNELTFAKVVPVDENNRGSDALDEGWRHSPSPEQLPIEWIQTIQQLFLEGTGEEYFLGSIQSLPVPDWEGNFMLFDSTESVPSSMRGLLWTTPFKDDIVRIVSFVLDSGSRGKGWGSVVWNEMVDTLWAKGYRRVQLEVRASNHRAITFYRNRGLEIMQELHGYYRQGMGYMMRGGLQQFHPNNDTPKHKV